MKLQTEEGKANKATLEKISDLLQKYRLRWDKVNSDLELLKTSVALLMIKGMNYCAAEGREQFNVESIFGESLLQPLRERQTALAESIKGLKSVMAELEKQ